MNRAGVAGSMSLSQVEVRLREAGFEVPAPPKPAANYVPWTRSGQTVYVAGQVPFVDGKLAGTGHVGAEVSLAQAQELAGVCARNAMAVLKEAAEANGTTLDRVRIVRASVFVAAAAGFTDIHVVANGASDLLAGAFGEQGIHSRSAVGVAELPLGVPVEVEVIGEFLDPVDGKLRSGA